MTSSMTNSSSDCSMNPDSWNGKDSLLCQVCGRRATGVHYGVTSCEGCKAFFKRGVLKNAQYTCYFGGTCVIVSKSSGSCKSCRFQKCFQAGMSLEASKSSRLRKVNVEGDASLQERCEYSKDELTEAKDLQASVDAGKGLMMRDDVFSYATAHVLAKDGRFGSVLSRKNSLHLCAEELETRAKDLPIAREMLGCETPFVDRREQSEITTRNPCRSMHTLLAGSVVIQRPIKNTPYHKFATKIDLSDDPVRTPGFMQKYWSIMQQRSNCLEHTIRSVTDAVESAYGDQITLWSNFMDKFLDEETYPSCLSASMETIVDCFADKAVDDTVRTAKFASLLPGYDEIDPNEKRVRIYDRGLGVFMLHHARYFRNGKTYFLAGRHHHHYTRYWMDALLEQDFVEFVVCFTQQLNKLQLTMTETYLLVALAVLKSDGIEDTCINYVDFLSSHYLDALVHLLGSRRAQILRELDAVVNCFRSLTMIQRRYVLALDTTRVPFMLPNGDSFMTVVNSLTNDGQEKDFVLYFHK